MFVLAFPPLAVAADDDAGAFVVDPVEAVRPPPEAAGSPLADAANDAGPPTAGPVPLDGPLSSLSACAVALSNPSAEDRAAES